jgi:hypothetical protein
MHDKNKTAPDWGFAGGQLWSEILPGLWMGGTADTDADGERHPEGPITKEDFNTVVTLYSSANPVDWYVKELRLGFYDHEEVDVDANDLHQVVQAAHEDWKAGRKVLIRCQAGLNRSGLVTALVLARDGMPIDEAMELLRQKRSPAALCNPDFVDWLVANYHVFLDEK